VRREARGVALGERERRERESRERERREREEIEIEKLTCGARCCS
jgi:hypothetical protein